VDQVRMGEALFRLEHRHSDGRWERLEPREAHDPAALDPEKAWEGGRIYACPTCDEQVRVRESPGTGAPDR
jgi:hypothetical protein